MSMLSPSVRPLTSTIISSKTRGAFPSLRSNKTNLCEKILQARIPERIERRKEHTRDRSHKDERKEERSKTQRRDSRSRDKRESEDVKDVKDVKPKENPVAQRRRMLRELLARRNTDEQIEELTKAFFERQASGTIAANLPV